MNPGGTPIFEGTLCKALKTPFLCLLFAQLPLKKIALSPKDPMCFEIWSEVTNLSHNDPWPMFFFIFW